MTCLLLHQAAHPHQVIQGITTLPSMKGHLQDEKVSSTSMTIMAIPLPEHIQDSEGAMPAKIMLVSTSKLQREAQHPSKSSSPRGNWTMSKHLSMQLMLH